MTFSSVLHLNVRLSEGGAAGVARALSAELRGAGIDSRLAYGYSKGGKASPDESELDAVRVTPRAVAAANRMAYALIGRETRATGAKAWTAFLAAMNDASAIHLHAVHSHIVDFDVLVDAIIDADKPVVWTLHDQWIMTGRCAQPGACRLWEQGCKVCPDLDAYPRGIIDRAGERWLDKRSAISRLREHVPVSVVACASWLAEEAEIAGLGPVLVIQNSVDRQFWNASRPTSRAPRKGRRNLFMCRDLRDSVKIDWELLADISRMQNQSLLVVGNDAPESAPRLDYQPAVVDRRELAALMGTHDRLIFTSPVDYFPLTVLEALSSGLEVFAIDSAAAREFEGHPGMHLFGGPSAMLDALSRVDDGYVYHPPVTPHAYSPDAMTASYIEAYESVTDQ